MYKDYSAGPILSTYAETCRLNRRSESQTPISNIGLRNNKTIAGAKISSCQKNTVPPRTGFNSNFPVPLITLPIWTTSQITGGFHLVTSIVSKIPNFNFGYNFGNNPVKANIKTPLPFLTVRS
jgi:hypothetical protein